MRVESRVIERKREKMRKLTSRQVIEDKKHTNQGRSKADELELEYIGKSNKKRCSIKSISIFSERMKEEIRKREREKHS